MTEHSAPSGRTPTARPAVKRANTDGLDPVRVRMLTDAGVWVTGQRGGSWRRSRVRGLVIRYMREGRSDADFRTWFLGYADPTGANASRAVDRERGWA